MTRSKTIYLVVSIDTECDKSGDWSVKQPRSFYAVTQGIPDVLNPLFDEFGVKPTYLLSPEVIAEPKCVETLKAVHRCELGTHLHGEFVEPDADFNADRTSTPQLEYAPQIEFEKLQNLTLMFERAFGFSATSFRAGRFGIGKHTLASLVRLNYTVDSSVVPFWKHRFKTHENNHWGAPIQPYHPKASNPVLAGKCPILEVPVSVINDFYVKWPRWILRAIDANKGIHRRALRRVGVHIPQSIWLRPQRSSAEELIRTAEQIIRAAGGDAAVLNMMYHNVEIVPGMSPYAATMEDVNRIVDSQRALFRHLWSSYDVNAVGLSDLVSYFPAYT